MQQTKDEIVESLKALEAERRELLEFEKNRTATMRREYEKQQRLTASLKQKEALIIQKLAAIVESQDRLDDQIKFLKLLEEENQAAITRFEEQTDC